MDLPKMPCAKMCPKKLRRFHLTCIYCHYRKAYTKQLNPKRYSLDATRYKQRIASYTTLFLAVDNDRRFAAAKGILLQKLMSIAEVLAN